MRRCTLTSVPDLPVATSTPSDPNHPHICLPFRVDLFQCFQSGIEAQLSSVATSLDRVTERITKLETQQQMLEKEMKQSTSSQAYVSQKNLENQEM